MSTIQRYDRNFEREMVESDIGLWMLYADHLADKQAAMEAARAAEWQDIETAPKDGTRIMLGIAGVTTYPAADLYLLGTWDGICSHPYVPNTWTHWMPLPPAPTTPEPRS